MSVHDVAIGALDLDCGVRLENVVQRVHLEGNVRDGGAGCVLVPHALTGDANPRKWWGGLIGPGRYIDTDDACVVGINVLGGCYGSTGPSSVAPDGAPYCARFPLISVFDMVRAQRRALEQLGITHLVGAIGASLGGMQALAWALEFPGALEWCTIVGASDAFSVTGIALNAVAAGAIRLDPHFAGGSYEADAPPREGLRLARKLAMITYKSEALFAERFGRRFRAGDDPSRRFGDRFDVEGYLDTHADRLADRFDANSYLVLSRAMDLFDATTRNDIRPGPGLTFVGIDSDVLFPARHVRASAERFASHGWRSRYVHFESDHGHDAFLAESERLGVLLAANDHSSPKMVGVAAMVPASISRTLTGG